MTKKKSTTTTSKLVKQAAKTAPMVPFAQNGVLDMKVTQKDLVEIYMNDQSEKIENELFDLKKKFINTLKAGDQIREDVLAKLTNLKRRKAESIVTANSSILDKEEIRVHENNKGNGVCGALPIAESDILLHFSRYNELYPKSSHSFDTTKVNTKDLVNLMTDPKVLEGNDRNPMWDYMPRKSDFSLYHLYKMRYTPAYPMLNKHVGICSTRIIGNDISRLAREIVYVFINETEFNRDKVSTGASRHAEKALSRLSQLEETEENYVVVTDLRFEVNIGEKSKEISIKNPKKDIIAIRSGRNNEKLQKSLKIHTGGTHKFICTIDAKDWDKIMTPIVESENEMYTLAKQIYKLYSGYVQFKSSTSRQKTKILKQLMSTTEEGRDLIDHILGS